MLYVRAQVKVKSLTAIMATLKVEANCCLAVI